MKTLEEFRKEIDEIDEKLLLLLQRRMELSEQIAEVKKQRNYPIFDPDREKMIQEHLLNCLSRLEYREAILKVFRQIFTESKKIQEKEQKKTSR